MAYLRSVKQVDLPTKEGAFLPPLLYGSYEHAPQLEHPLSERKRMRLSGLAGSARSLVLARLRHAAPLIVLMRDEERAGYLYADLEGLLGSDAVLRLVPSSALWC